MFGDGDSRPANRRDNGAGLDVSPALNGCLGFAELNGDGDLINWQFVETSQVRVSVPGNVIGLPGAQSWL